MKKNTEGFTLVELAIVMTIIGLLIGGVLKGQQLMRNAQITKSIKQMQSYSTAFLTFRDTFNYYPGDFASARQRIPQCDNAHFCLNGNGDNFVGNSRDPSWDSQINESEAVQFWKHLALANMIGIIEPSANPAAPLYGTTHPSSPFGGGYEFYYDRLMLHGAGGTTDAHSHILRLSQGGPAGQPRYILSQLEAAQIDRKIDNGDPNSGDIIADYGPSNNECKGLNSGIGFYKENSRSGGCILYYQLD